MRRFRRGGAAVALATFCSRRKRTSMAHRVRPRVLRATGGAGQSRSQSQSRWSANVSRVDNYLLFPMTLFLVFAIVGLRHHDQRSRNDTQQ